MTVSKRGPAQASLWSNQQQRGAVPQVKAAKSLPQVKAAKSLPQVKAVEAPPMTEEHLRATYLAWRGTTLFFCRLPDGEDWDKEQSAWAAFAQAAVYWNGTDLEVAHRDGGDCVCLDCLLSVVQAI